MAWERLREDYVDAVFEGLRKYQLIENQDGSYSFADVTSYTIRENAFLGAKDINAMNTAMNLIMSALNNGTDLYGVFTKYFELQQKLFKESADSYSDDFLQYLDELKLTYQKDITEFKDKQEISITHFIEVKESAFEEWFTFIKAQLTTDAAGKLLTLINTLDEKLDNFIKLEMTAERVDELYDSIKVEGD